MTKFVSATNEVIIATYGVAAVGINIPRIFNLGSYRAWKIFRKSYSVNW